MVKHDEKGRSRRIPTWLRWLTGVIVVLVALVVLAGLFDWNMLRGPIGRQVSAMAGRRIELRGDLKVHLLSWTPGATADDVEVGSTPGVTSGDLAHIGRFAVKIKLLPLLIGRVELPLVDFEQPTIWAVRNADGLSNWRSKANDAKPTKLPPIQHLVINQGQLQMTDQKRRMTLSAQLQSSETLNGGGQGAFHLTGRGALNHEPFSLDLNGGALIQVRTDRPYAFNADLRSGQTHITAHGVLPRPFDLGQVKTAVTVTGANLANLYYLIGVALPNTGTYHLSGDLVRDNQTYRFTNVTGGVGHSDLEGAFTVGHDGTRPKLTADLRSRMLDLADLAVVTGAPARGAGAVPPPAVASGQPRRLMPDATLDVSRVRSTDAVVRYQADAVLARPGLPLRQFKLDLTLDHGVMTADPITFGFPQGQLTGTVRIDARPDTPRDTLDLRVTNVRVQDFLAKPGATSPLDGTLEARARLTGQGDSVHQVASTADGEVTFVAPRGQVRKSIAELLGVDVTKGLGLLLSDNQSQMGLRCAVADFHADRGVLTARELVFDSDAVLVKGAGTIDLRDEMLDLTLKGQPKSFRLVRLNAPITVTGPLSGPKFGVQAGGAATQVGTAVALGVFLTPAAALLPFVDPGLAHDADCVGAIEHAQGQGVPVKASATTPTGAKAAPAKR
jgi:uncharacterized protein involved in outer membrane biogenesis